VITTVVAAGSGSIIAMPIPPESTKISLRQRLRAHAAAYWPQLAGLRFRYHGQFVYVEGELAGGEIWPLIRLRYGGSAGQWGFGLYLASSGKYENQILPSGLPVGSPEEALDCAAGLYLARLGI
jgi:hypothetical protein